jgi:hypothetical protein
MSLIRDNLMTRPGYSPYCGDAMCPHGMPRTRFTKGQFQCSCGWRSGFDAEFIAQYQAHWASTLTSADRATVGGEK